MNQVSLAKELALPRSTTQYYIGKGMPTEPAEARQWLADYRASKSKDVAIPVPSSPVAGDNFEDRMSRLKNSEKAISGEIAAAYKQQMDLVSLLIGSEGDEKAKTERQLGALNQRLIQLRKQHMSITKILCDLELKKTQMARDLIDVGRRAGCVR